MDKRAAIAEINARIQKNANDHTVYHSIEEFSGGIDNFPGNEYLFKPKLINPIGSIAISFLIISIVAAKLVGYSKEKYHDITSLMAGIWFTLLCLGGIFGWGYYEFTTRLFVSEKGVQYRKRRMIFWDNILTMHIRISHSDDYTYCHLVIYHYEMMSTRIVKDEYSIKSLKESYTELAKKLNYYKSKSEESLL